MAEQTISWSETQRRGNDTLQRHRLNLEGMLHFEGGQVARAEACWRELLAFASDGHDDDFVARANNNLGVICTLHARGEEALACYERAIAAYRRVGRRRGIAQAHQNLGITYRELDFASEADHHFLTLEALAAVAERRGDLSQAAELRTRADHIFAQLGAIVWGRTRDRATRLATPA